uniref:Secreted protein n=1 Tax=Steinernema glaseri TaxID=37863 RepID=A0A1I7ZRL9_9BILA
MLDRCSTVGLGWPLIVLSLLSSSFRTANLLIGKKHATSYVARHYSHCLDIHLRHIPDVQIWENSFWVLKMCREKVPLNLKAVNLLAAKSKNSYYLQPLEDGRQSLNTVLKYERMCHRNNRHWSGCVSRAAFAKYVVS